MGVTKTIKNVLDVDLEVVIYSGQFGEGRRRITMLPGQALNVSRVTPEAKLLADDGVLFIGRAGDPLPAAVPQVQRRMPEPPKPARAKATAAKTVLPYQLMAMGHAWQGEGPAPISYAADLEQRVSDRTLALLFPNTSNGDIDWWNGDIGPWSVHAQQAAGDFAFAVNVSARGGFKESTSNDWMGVIVQRADDPFAFVRVAAMRRVYGDDVTPAQHVFEILCQHGHTGTAAAPEEAVVTLPHDSVIDWSDATAAGALIGELAVKREMQDERDVYPISVAREGDDFKIVAKSDAGVVRRTIRNFFGPNDKLLVGVALGRYVSQGSKFIGAEFTNLVANW